MGRAALWSGCAGTRVATSCWPAARTSRCGCGTRQPPPACRFFYVPLQCSVFIAACFAGDPLSVVVLPALPSRRQWDKDRVWRQMFKMKKMFIALCVSRRGCCCCLQLYTCRAVRNTSSRRRMPRKAVTPGYRSCSLNSKLVAGVLRPLRRGDLRRFHARWQVHSVGRRRGRPELEGVEPKDRRVRHRAGPPVPRLRRVAPGSLAGGGGGAGWCNPPPVQFGCLLIATCID